jgi:uncharacterized cupredoxin-like copper-binding protein
MPAIDQALRLTEEKSVMKQACIKGAAVATAVAAVLTVPFIPAALAHGDSHSAPKAVDYSGAEETPFGRAGNPKKVNRTIRLGMDDGMHFKVTASAAKNRSSDVPMSDGAHAMAGDIVVKRGETVRFLVRNDGKLMHEMVIGTIEDLRKHAELMRSFPGMEHDEAHMAHVAPGNQGEIVWQFTRPGKFHYACLVPGHMEAGMIAKITVK